MHPSLHSHECQHPATSDSLLLHLIKNAQYYPHQISLSLASRRTPPICVSPRRNDKRNKPWPPRLPTQTPFTHDQPAASPPTRPRAPPPPTNTTPTEAGPNTQQTCPSPSPQRCATSRPGAKTPIRPRWLTAGTSAAAGEATCTTAGCGWAAAAAAAEAVIMPLVVAESLGECVLSNFFFFSV